MSRLCLQQGVFVVGCVGLLGLGSCGQAPPCPVAAPPPPPPVVVTPAPAQVAEPAKPLAGQPFAVTRRQNYRIEFGNYAIEIDPVEGARILEFSLNRKSIVVPVGESPETFGSSLWSSPQSDWNWPPPAEFDKLPWNVTVEPQSLLLESKVSEQLGLAVKQRITAEPDLGAVLLEYELVNHGKTPRKVAPWQNTRVRPGGLTFYPASKPTYSYKENTLPLVPEAGIVWFQHVAGEATKDSRKSYADGEEGWLAQVDDRLLFIKQFENVKPTEQAPKEGEIVLYVDRKARFVEVEQQGSYQEIAPGASRHWKVRWYLRQLPDQVKVEQGNQALVDYVREQLVGKKL